MSRTAEGSQCHVPLARTRHKRPRHVALRMQERDKTWQQQNHKRKKVALLSLATQSICACSQGLLAGWQAKSSKQERQASPLHRAQSTWERGPASELQLQQMQSAKEHKSPRRR